MDADDECSFVSNDGFADFLEGGGQVPVGLEQVVEVLQSAGRADNANRHAVVARMAEVLTPTSNRHNQGVPMFGRFSRRTIVIASGSVFALGGVAAAAGGGGVIADVFTRDNDGVEVLIDEQSSTSDDTTDTTINGITDTTVTDTTDVSVDEACIDDDATSTTFDQDDDCDDEGDDDDESDDNSGSGSDDDDEADDNSGSGSDDDDDEADEDAEHDAEHDSEHDEIDED